LGDVPDAELPEMLRHLLTTTQRYVEVTAGYTD